MVPIYTLNPINAERATFDVSTGTGECTVPVAHMRLYKESLKGMPWSGDPFSYNCDEFTKCDETGCEFPATHTEHHKSGSYRACSGHCTCINHLTGDHMSAPLHPDDEQQCFMHAHKLRLYWERTRDLPDKVHGTVESIDIDDRCPPEVRKRIRKFCEARRHVFEHAACGKPLQVKWPLHKIQLKEGAKPRRVPEPVWGHGSYRNVMTKWARNALASGQFEHCTFTQCASRPHIANKKKRGSTKDAADHGIRVCGDYSPLNKECIPMQANAPNVHWMIERAAGHAAYWYMDGEMMYNGFGLHPESRSICAIHTPLGLIQPTCLQFGLMNAGVVAQGAVRLWRERDLSIYTKNHSVSIADDLTGWCGHFTLPGGELVIDWTGLEKSFCETIEMANKNNYSINPLKTCFGSPRTDFFGFNLNIDGWQSADHNLSPIERCVAPADVPELRRVLGLFVQHKDRIPWYSPTAACLHKLTRKGYAWRWGAAEQAAFDTLREACLRNGVLAAPDYAKQFIVATDASDDGKGCVVYQLKDASEPDTAESGNRKIICYYSKAWKEAMQKRPAYYREGDALITSIKIGSYYSLASPFPLLVHTDQAPLRYIDTCAKGPVVAWRIENLGGVPYQILYRAGPKNIVPDALSRYPFLGPKTMRRSGILHALEDLLANLPNALKGPGCVWIWASRDTRPLSHVLKKWSGASRMHLRAPKESFQNKQWKYAVLIPRADTATDTLRDAINDGRPACVLVPTDIVPYAAQNRDGTFDMDIAKTIADAKKISLCSPLMTWVCLNVGLEHDVVYAGEGKASPPAGAASWSPLVGTRADWVNEQKSSLLAEAGKVDRTRLAAREDGLLMIVGADGLYRAYVPLPRRESLFKFTHESINHLADDKTYQELRENYYWPGMRAECRMHYMACPFCDLSKAKRNHAHGRFRGVRGSAPRSRWGMDFYGVGDGYVLGMIDLDSRWIELCYLQTREADGVLRAVRDQILFRHGVPDTVHSDHAREFVGRALTKLATEFGYVNTTTGGYCATGNSTIERFWGYLGICLRSLSDADYQTIEDRLQQMAWTWNTVKNGTSVRPFEIMTGVQPKTISGSILRTEAPLQTPMANSTFAESAAEFRRIALANDDYMRERRAATLNKRGRKLRELQVGDYVKMYIPPGHVEAVRRKRKAKHIVQFRGPLRIDERPSGTTMVLSCYFNPKNKFRRNITNVRRWNGPLPSKDAVNMAAPPCTFHDIEEGDFMFVREDNLAKKMDLTCVDEIDNENITVRCFGTTGKSPASAVFTPVWIMKDGLPQLTKPRKNVKATPWTWTIKTEDFKELVVSTECGLRATGKLTSAAIRTLSKAKPMKLRRFTTR